MPKHHRVNFEDLKARADFRAVLAHYGLTIVGQGEQAKVLCPFHEDERPSCSVNLAKGLFHCFTGGCEASGNVLDFVHRMEGRSGAPVSLRQAGLRLAEICGIALPGKGAQTPQNGSGTTTRAKAASSPSRAAKGASAASTGSGAPSPDGARGEHNKKLGFELTLDPEHPYLAERGLPRELVARFGLGYCEKGTMAGRVCIPIHNAKGELVAYAGRWAGSMAELPEGEEKYKLPKGFHKALELFNLHRVAMVRHLILVEGFFGAIRLHALRLPSAALMGSSLSEEQVKLLLEACPNLSHVTLLMDGDEPGRKAAEAIASRLSRHWWTRTVTLPEGAEPDTIEPQALNLLLRRSRLE